MRLKPDKNPKVKLDFCLKHCEWNKLHAKVCKICYKIYLSLHASGNELIKTISKMWQFSFLSHQYFPHVIHNIHSLYHYGQTKN